MIVYPNAKINLGLNIIEKRADAFHNIESVFYPIGLCDILEIVEDKAIPENSENRVSMTISGIEVPGKMEDNLCFKAYQLIANEYYLPPIKIHLQKVIPIGAGLGGGSSDAAFFVRALNDLFDLNLSFGEMHNYARQLGSDCSFFINNQAVFAQQRGDEFERISLDLSAYYIVLVYPAIHISTAEAYSGVKPQKTKHSIEELIKEPMNTWKESIVNDFEESVFVKHPSIQKIKNELYEKGAIYSSMSGSGSSVFGIFQQPTNLKNCFPNSFVWEAKL